MLLLNIRLKQVCPSSGTDVYPHMIHADFMSTHCATCLGAKG